MDVSSTLQLILSTIVNPCLTTSPWIQGTPGELHMSQTIHCLCCVAYNVLVKYWFIFNPTL